jgi:hypothetical protein
MGFTRERLVLPDRIELSTSPLPMECSTTELRQRAPDQENRPERPLQGVPILATRPPRAQARDRPAGPRKVTKSARDAGQFLQPAQLRADPAPHFLAQRLQRLDGADHDLEFDHFAGVIEFDEIDAL